MVRRGQVGETGKKSFAASCLVCREATGGQALAGRTEQD